MKEINDFLDQNPPVVIAMTILLLVMIAVKRLRRTVQHNGGFLDRVILYLGNIPFTGKMATEGLFTCAELGAGKTFLVFRTVAEAYVKAGMGGIILGAKAEDLKTVTHLFRDLGAEKRLVVIGPRHRHRINCFEALASIAPPDSIEDEIIGFFTSLMQIEGRASSKSNGEDTRFFVSHGQRLLGAILICLRLSGEQISASNIYRFLVTLPQTAEVIGTPAWQSGYAAQCIGRAFNSGKSVRDFSDYENAQDYLLGELATLNNRTRSSIVSTVSSMLSKLLRGWMAEIWSTETTARFQDMFEGKWLYIDTSPLEFGEYGVSSLVLAKHLAQRCVMRRNIEENSRSVAIMGDEWQAIFVTGDRDYQAVCRSQRGCTWAATQNITGLYSVLGGGKDAESQVQSWIALFGAKIFAANTDWTTNTYASQLCGMKLEDMFTTNTSPKPESTPFDLIKGDYNTSTGSNQQYQPQVRPEHFVQLRKPEPPRYEADAILIMPRLLQVTGRHWAEITLRPEE